MRRVGQGLLDPVSVVGGQGVRSGARAAGQPDNLVHAGGDLEVTATGGRAGPILGLELKAPDPTGLRAPERAENTFSLSTRLCGFRLLLGCFATQPDS